MGVLRIVAINRGLWALAPVVAGCAAQPVAQPVLAPAAPAPVVRRSLALPLTGPRDIFLLKADGTPFGDEQRRYRGEVAAPPYTSRLELSALKAVAPTGTRYSVAVVLPHTDAIHNVSDDRPAVFFEVDGTPLRDGEAVDSVIQTVGGGDRRSTRITFSLLDAGLAQVRNARNQVAIKVRLRSDAFANVGECAQAAPGSADSENCRKPYTGRTIEGKSLARLKAFLGGN